jgi:hypothetical protein
MQSGEDMSFVGVGNETPIVCELPKFPALHWRCRAIASDLTARLLSPVSTLWQTEVSPSLFSLSQLGIS